MEKITDFQTFWHFYLGEHSQPATKILHAIGTAGGLFCHLVVIPLTQNLWWVPVGFASTYAFAWGSHAFIEKNRPATFTHPYWSFYGDMEMCHLMILGWMPGELAELAGKAPGQPTELRRMWRTFIQVVIPLYFVVLSTAYYYGYVHW